MYLLKRVKVFISHRDEGLCEQPIFVFCGEEQRIQRLLKLVEARRRSRLEIWALGRRLGVLAWPLRAPNYTTAERALRRAGVELGQPLESLNALPAWLRQGVERALEEAREREPPERRKGVKSIRPPREWPPFIQKAVRRVRRGGGWRVYFFKERVVVYREGEEYAVSFPSLSTAFSDIVKFVEEEGEVPAWLAPVLREAGFEELAAAVALVGRLLA